MCLVWDLFPSTQRTIICQLNRLGKVKRIKVYLYTLEHGGVPPSDF
jgi:hypothetical protein